MLPRIRSRLLPSAAAVLLVLAGTAGATPQELSVETYTLPNGLTVILHEDHTLPQVTINTWFAVGSKDEPPGRSNLDRTVQAFASALERREFAGSLVCVGPRTNLDLKVTRRAETLGVADRLVLLGSLSAEDQPAVFQSAELFLYPALEHSSGRVVVDALAERSARMRIAAKSASAPIRRIFELATLAERAHVEGSTEVLTHLGASLRRAALELETTTNALHLLSEEQLDTALKLQVQPLRPFLRRPARHCRRRRRTSLHRSRRTSRSRSRQG